MSSDNATVTVQTPKDWASAWKRFYYLPKP
jgi:hypothetical protein